MKLLESMPYNYIVSQLISCNGLARQNKDFLTFVQGGINHNLCHDVYIGQLLLVWSGNMLVHICSVSCVVSMFVHGCVLFITSLEASQFSDFSFNFITLCLTFEENFESFLFGCLPVVLSYWPLVSILTVWVLIFFIYLSNMWISVISRVQLSRETAAALLTAEAKL